MKSSAIIASVILALTAGTAGPQSGSFDARKFFERLQFEGASATSSLRSATRSVRG